MPIRWYYEIFFYLECGVEFKISMTILLTMFFKTNKSFEIIYIGAINTTANAYKYIIILMR